MAKAIRTSITIPADLKERMDAAEEPTNWSALACKAFEDRLAEIAARKVKKDLNDVVSRMRAAKRKARGEAYEAGSKAGEEWAKSDADPVDLANLDKFYREVFESYSRVSFLDTGAESGLTNQLRFQTAVSERAFNHHGLQALLRRVAPGNPDKSLNIADNQYLYGFTQGALDVWDQVKDDI